MPDEIYFTKYDILGPYHWKAFSDNPDDLDAFVRGVYENVIGIVSGLELNEGAKVLDVGCGDGALLGEFAKRFDFALYGADVNENAVKLAKEMFDKYSLAGSFEKIEPYSYPFGDDSFDLVVSTDVIEHVRFPEKLLSEVKRVLKPGGYFIVTTPNRFSKIPESNLHVCEWFPEEFEEMLTPFFGEPVKKIFSHPLFLYELYVYSEESWWRKKLADFVNLSAKAGKNPFLQNSENSKWKYFAMQTYLYRKSQE